MFKHVHELVQAEPRHAEVLGHLLFAAKLVAEKEGIVDGFRVVINNGPEACKSLQSFFTDFLYLWLVRSIILCHSAFRSISLSSTFACTWWKAVEMASWITPLLL